MKIIPTKKLGIRAMIRTKLHLKLWKKIPNLILVDQLDPVDHLTSRSQDFEPKNKVYILKNGECHAHLKAGPLAMKIPLRSGIGPSSSYEEIFRGRSDRPCPPAYFLSLGSDKKK